MIDRHSSYKPADTMRDLLRDNNLLLFALSRFGIEFGFGDATVREACEANGVATDTFLSVANLLSCREHEQYHADLDSLMQYLKTTHRYYLEISLPRLRHRIIEVISSNGADDVGLMLVKFFDDYASELKEHLEEENEKLFPYVEGLLDGKLVSDFSINAFTGDHSPVTDKLQELKGLFIYHYSNPDNLMLSAVLYEIVTLEKDLLNHFEIENHLFLPMVVKLEGEVKNTLGRVDGKEEAEHPLSALGEREKEIIRFIALGYSNKEIADKLCISVHTVATHRKNIISKLHIHSAAGLTIFAILHGLIDMSEVK